MKDIRLAYAQNRAEEQPKDIWQEFVIPPYYSSLPFGEQKKSIHIQGGRGCGKTMLLRYLSHASQFSPRRDNVTEDDLKYIGLYLRADTSYLAAMQGADIDEAIWQRAFSHWVACSLTLEFIESLYSINCDEVRVDAFGKLDCLDFSELREVYPQLGIDLPGLRRSLILERNKLTAWINNLENYPRPIFLPGKDFLLRVVEISQSELSYLKGGIVAVFIDEYENLLDYQQKIINEFVKHGSAPLIVNVAAKRNGLTNPTTRGPESIQNIGDLRLIDIEDQLGHDFELFAAELLFFRLAETAPELQKLMPISLKLLRDPKRVSDRTGNIEYRKKVISAAGRVFPRLSEKELAKDTFDNNTLRTHLRENIISGLKLWDSLLDPNDFMRATAPEASLVSGALLNRKSVAPEIILAELLKYANSKENRFESSEWIKNNLIGVILQLYSKVNRCCPFFAGFETIVLISRGNVRHFLEMLHQSFLKAEVKTDKIPELDVYAQAEAVRAASSEFLLGVRSSGMFGNRLHGLTLSLGSIFKEKQRQVAQSEPEINHFSINSGDVNENITKYLQEAVKWSVLYEERETKKKYVGIKTVDYILNPIFSAYFQISYRKKRSIPISAEDFLTMLEGDVQRKDEAVRRLTRVSLKDGKNTKDVNYTLPLDFFSEDE